MSTEPAVSERVVQIDRTFSAPPERVYEAMTNAAIAKQWWTGPPWELTELTLEARPGGRFVYAIRSSEDGSEYRTYGEYLAAEKPHRLIWTNAEGGGTLVNVHLQRDGAGTRLTVFQGVYSSPDERDMHQQGWSGCLDNLDRLLTR